MAELGSREKPKLKQELRWWQIFFIVLSAVVGEGIFFNTGLALQLAGPAGLLLAFFVVSFVALMVMEGISEFIQLFPAPNALYEYIRAFVDEDLAWVVGIAYWYVFAAVFAIQNLAAADHASTFMSNNFEQWQIIGFYVVSPIALTVINLLGVLCFGWVETAGGILKLFLLVFCACILFIIAGTGGTHCPPVNPALGEQVVEACSYASTQIDINFHYNPQYVYNVAQGVIYAMPIVLFSFLGMETFIVTAYEAKKPVDLRWSSKWMALIVFLLYLLVTIGEVLTVRWYDVDLPQLFAGLSGNTAPGNSVASSSTLVIIAANRAKNTFIHKHIPKLFSGCLVYSNLSAANTSLYLASRILYGLAREIPSNKSIIFRYLHKLSIVEPRTGVPITALLFSTLSFCWLPFLTTKKRNTLSSDETIQVISDSTSISTLMIWGLLSFAFIRYDQWLDKCQPTIRRRFPQFDRCSILYRHHTVFRKLQPLPAYIGLIGCVCFFGFASGPLWRTSRKTQTSVEVSNAASAYGAPIILIIVFIILKLANLHKRWKDQNRWGWVFLSPNPADLEDRLARLDWNKNDPEKNPSILAQDDHEDRNLQAQEPAAGQDSIELSPMHGREASGTSDLASGSGSQGLGVVTSEASQQALQNPRDPSFSRT